MGYSQPFRVSHPLIPEYNTDVDTVRSFEALEVMGLPRSDRFDYVIRETMTE